MNEGRVLLDGTVDEARASAKVQEVYIGSGASEVAVRFLENLPDLQKLEIQVTQVSDLGLASVQRLRHQAVNHGSLKNCAQHRVVQDGGTIAIEPTNPHTAYVPYYNPDTVYGSWAYPDYPAYYWPQPYGYGYSHVNINSTSFYTHWGTAVHATGSPAGDRRQPADRRCPAVQRPARRAALPARHAPGADHPAPPPHEPPGQLQPARQSDRRRRHRPGRSHRPRDRARTAGGGSTTLAMENPETHTRAIVNTLPSNAKARSVGSSLAVFAQPRAQ
jgi:hypothetical protein